ncbi:unnamed protein product [Lasius platythorax]|uniref:Uncharacterized protein n=1 Tax=Lasius platythorax TaxID=488582 RepID=A0AAV2NCA4_9HYME
MNIRELNPSKRTANRFTGAEHHRGSSTNRQQKNRARIGRTMRRTRSSFFPKQRYGYRGSRPRQSSVGRNRLKGFRIYRVHPNPP